MEGDCAGKVKLPKRQKAKGYKDPDWNYRYIPEKY
jgi:hypothetical protein